MEALASFLTDFTKFLNAFLTLIISLVVCGYVMKQYFMQVTAVRLELFDKRFKVYEQTKALLKKLVQDKVEIKELQEENLPINISLFLFKSKDVYLYLYQLRKLAIEYNYMLDGKKLPIDAKQFDHLFSEEEAKDILKDSISLSRWFYHEYEGIEQRFMKYLNFQDSFNIIRKKKKKG
jgi:hypothetical protein